MSLQWQVQKAVLCLVLLLPLSLIHGKQESDDESGKCLHLSHNYNIIMSPSLSLFHGSTNALHPTMYTSLFPPGFAGSFPYVQ